MKSRAQLPTSRPRSRDRRGPARSRVVRGLASVVAAGVVVGLTGCAAGSGSDALVINGDNYTIEQVQQTATALASTAGTEPTLRDQQIVVAALVVQSLAQQAVADAGNQISPADREAALATVPGGSALAENPGTQLYTDAVADVLYASSTVGSTALASQQAGTDIRINPRYGTWDTQQMTLVTGSGSLSVAVQGAGSGN